MYYCSYKSTILKQNHKREKPRRSQRISHLKCVNSNSSIEEPLSDVPMVTSYPSLYGDCVNTAPNVGASRTEYPQYMPTSVLGALGATTVPEIVLASVDEISYWVFSEIYKHSMISSQIISVFGIFLSKLSFDIQTVHMYTNQSLHLIKSGVENH